MAEPEVDLAKTISDLSKNAEAGVALTTIAIVDEWLQKLLLTGMKTVSNGVAKRIFGSYGPLYELAPKADIAFAFGLIDGETLADLRALRDIRNAFAHTRDMLNFESAEIAELCQKLSGWKFGCNNRVLFDAVAVQCVKKIDARTQTLLFDSAIQAPASDDN